MENQGQQDLNGGPMADELDIGENPIVDIGVSLLMYFWQYAGLLRNRLRGGIMITRSMALAMERNQRKRRAIDPSNPRHVLVDDEGNERPYINIETPELRAARTRQRRMRNIVGTIATMGLRSKILGKVYGNRRMSGAPIYNDPSEDPGGDYFGPMLPDRYLGPVPNRYLGPVPAGPAQKALYLEYPNMNRGGGAMLQWKNKLTRRYTTHCDYFMGPQLYGIAQQDIDDIWFYRHHTDFGSGPSLYSKYDNELSTTGGTRNPTLGVPKDIDAGTDANNYFDGQTGVGKNTIIYCFAADWPFITMNHDARTQVLDRTFVEDGTDVTYDNKQLGCFLKWRYHAYDPLFTDNNIPIQLNYFLKNKDWTYLTHYSTTYNFDITNLSTQPYVVEILFFTFKADPDAMDYGRQVRAPLNRQDQNMDNYINRFQQYPEDINIQYRKRIYLKGIDNLTIASNNWKILPNGYRENNTTWSYKVKRKYVMKRPILKLNAQGNIDDMTEDELFNTYYEPD